jgi:hypothetical protein
LPCEGSGRWFESSRACRADVAQREERRVASPEMPVRSGSSVLRGPWCNRKAWRAPTSLVRVRILADLFVAGRSWPVIWHKRFESAPGLHPHDRDDESAPGRNGSVIDYASTGRGFESRPEHSCSGSSVGRAVPGCTTTTAAVPLNTVDTTAGRRGSGYLSPRSSGRSRTSARRTPGLHFRSSHPRPR